MKTKLITMLLLLPSAMNAFACQDHGGFGFGSFGNFHPLAQQHMNKVDTTELKITHANKLNVSTDTDTQLQLSYVVPNDYRNAEVTLTPSKNLTIDDSSPLSLSKAQGMIDVKFKATGPGEHFIMVRIDATQGYRPYSKIQRVSVTAI